MKPTRADGAVSQEEARIAETIARKVVEIVQAELLLRTGEEDWIDSKEVARRFGLSRAWVYAHAGRLGAVPIGDGTRPRLRFIPSVVARALAETVSSPPEVEPEVRSATSLPIHVPRVRSKGSVP